MSTRRTTTGPDFMKMYRALVGRVANLENNLPNMVGIAVSQAQTNVKPGTINDSSIQPNALTGASLSLGLALQGSLSTAYGFVNNSSGIFHSAPSQFSTNSIFTDPDPAVPRDAKFGNQGIAVTGGTKTDSLNVTGSTAMAGLTLAGIGSFGNSAIALNQPTTFTNGVLFSNASVSFTGRPLLGANVAFDTITGANGAGVGNIAPLTITGYNVADSSIPFTKLTGSAQAQISALSTQDTPYGFLRRVSRTGTSPDPGSGAETDGMTINGGATRVADQAAYAGWAITSATMAGVGLAVSGPTYSGLQPGKYGATFYVRTSAGGTSGNVMSLTVSGTNVTSTTAVMLGSDIPGTYVGVSVPFTVTALTNTVNTTITNLDPSAASWNFSHVAVSPIQGVITPGTVDSFLASASITNAKIVNLSAGKIAAGTITSDNIFVGAGGHIYAGTSTQSPTGMTARVEMNAAGFYGYDGTQNTFALTNTGLTLTGTVNATGGTITGNMTVTGTLTGGTLSGSTITGGSITGTTITGTSTITGATIIGSLVETSATAGNSRSLMTSDMQTGGFTVEREAASNYLSNPGMEYTNAISGGFAFTRTPTNYVSGGNAPSTVGVCEIYSADHDPYAQNHVVLPVGLSHRMLVSFYAGQTGGTLAAAQAANSTTFDSAISPPLQVGSYININVNVLRRVIFGTLVSGSTYRYTLDSPIPAANAAGAGFTWFDKDIQAPCVNLAPSTTYTVTVNVACDAPAFFIDATHLMVVENKPIPLSAPRRTHSWTTYTSRFTPITPDTTKTWTTIVFTFTTESDWYGPAYLNLPGAVNSTGGSISGTNQIYYDSLQIENNSYPTDYIDGDQGAGFAWTGTAGGSRSTRANGSFVRFPHIGTHKIQGSLNVDALDFPIANTRLVPDVYTRALGGTTTAGLDLNGRGVQSTLATLVPYDNSLSITGNAVNTEVVNMNSITMHAGRLYKIVFTLSGVRCSDPNVGYYWQLGLNHVGQSYVYFRFNCVNINQYYGSGTFTWYHRPTSSEFSIAVSAILRGGTGGTAATMASWNGYDQIEITDMGIQR